MIVLVSTMAQAAKLVTFRSGNSYRFTYPQDLLKNRILRFRGYIKNKGPLPIHLGGDKFVLYDSAADDTALINDATKLGFIADEPGDTHVDDQEIGTLRKELMSGKLIITPYPEVALILGRTYTLEAYNRDTNKWEQKMKTVFQGVNRAGEVDARNFTMNDETVGPEIQLVFSTALQIKPTLLPTKALLEDIKNLDARIILA